MLTTFNVGVPSQTRLVITRYGPGTFAGMNQNGSVNLYIGAGRTFTIPGNTSWREACT